MKRRRVKNKRISLFTDFVIAAVIVATMFFFTELKGGNIKESSSYKVPTDIFSKEEKNRKNQNRAIAREIQDKYKIEVNYGKDTEENVKALDATILTNEDIVYKNILLLKETLEKYPTGFFNEFKNESNNYSVGIYLVDSFNSNNVALATRNTNNEFKIYISNDEDFEKVMHHELYHIIEYFIKLEYDIDELYANWNKYNPATFVYPNDVSKLDEKYYYKEGKDKEEKVYFVSKYAKTNAKEDRAETFSDMMHRKNKMYYYSEEHPVYSKARLISEVIQSSFKSVKEDTEEKWERYLN